MSKLTDLTGMRFERLLVINRNYEKKTKNTPIYWNCLCDCGNTTISAKEPLLNGSTKSCGCLKKERFAKMRLVDLTGKTFGRLKVLHQVRDNDNIRWVCQCSCGNITRKATGTLIAGSTISCGCAKNHTLSPEIKKALKAFSKYKTDAINRRGIGFLLTEEFFIEKFNLPCFYCGILRERRGMDRIDSKLGYSESNTVPCCSFCNFGKNRFELNDFLNYLEDIYNMSSSPKEKILLQTDNGILKEKYESKIDYKLRKF